MIAPVVIAKLLLGAEIEGSAVILGNVAGISLISLAIACWPRGEKTSSSAYFAMIFYNLMIALLLAETGWTSGTGGILLWPIVVIHLLFGALIALALIGSRRSAAIQS
jgi:hypothetical protein